MRNPDIAPLDGFTSRRAAAVIARGQNKERTIAEIALRKNRAMLSEVRIIHRLFIG
jgi:hypothetical protein